MLTYFGSIKTTMSIDDFKYCYGLFQGIALLRNLLALVILQITIIEHLQFVGDDEGNDTTTQALFKHDETTYTPITVLERVNLLETDMIIEDIF